MYDSLECAITFAPKISCNKVQQISYFHFNNRLLFLAVSARISFTVGTWESPVIGVSVFTIVESIATKAAMMNIAARLANVFQ